VVSRGMGRENEKENPFPPPFSSQNHFFAG